MKYINKKIKIIENNITNIRKQSMEKNIWLFILAVSISSLPTEPTMVKFIVFILGICIYVYYFNLIYTAESFNDMYNKLINKVNLKYSNDKKELEYCLCKIIVSKNNIKSNKFNLFLYIALVVFYFTTFILFCIKHSY